MKQNVFAKVMASIALWAIVVGILGTGLLFIFTAWGGSGDDYDQQEQSVTEQEIKDMIQSFSGELDSATFSWSTEK